MMSSLSMQLKPRYAGIDPSLPNIAGRTLVESILTDLSASIMDGNGAETRRLTERALLSRLSARQVSDPYPSRRHGNVDAMRRLAIMQSTLERKRPAHECL